MSKTLSTASPDALKGRQLTEQYHRATGGMREVLIFGAMMLQLRAEHPEMTQRGGDRRSKPALGQCSDEEAPLTLSKWLETFAPEVKRQTAQRFLAVTESVASEYMTIVGPKVAKTIDLPTLITTPAKKLDEKLAAKQLELFEWVNGTSQRSWLDRFSPKRKAPPPGGKSAKNDFKGGAHNRSDDLDPAVLRETALENNNSLRDMRQGCTWQHLHDDELNALHNQLEGWLHDIALLIKTRKDAEARAKGGKK